MIESIAPIAYNFVIGFVWMSLYEGPTGPFGDDPIMHELRIGF